MNKSTDRNYQEAFPGYLNVNNVITIQAPSITFYIAYSDLARGWVIQSRAPAKADVVYDPSRTLSEAFARIAIML
jgi:hypothetical protein